MSQRRRVRSQPPLRACRMDQFSATHVTSLAWPTSFRNASARSRSQRSRTWSLPPLTARWAVQSTATQRTELRWPWSSRKDNPLLRSHSLRLRSPLPLIADHARVHTSVNDTVCSLLVGRWSSLRRRSLGSRSRPSASRCCSSGTPNASRSRSLTPATVTSPASSSTVARLPPGRTTSSRTKLAPSGMGSLGTVAMPCEKEGKLGP
mmetsp:Transcript_79469/g.236758  ORF Transcript_79469/g.236758 Transcript_79469/m.236758 type:complete len:206 (-) Transcript_79469:8-625(-)